MHWKGYSGILVPGQVKDGALGCEGAFLWQSAQLFLWTWSAAVMPAKKTVSIVCENRGPTL